MPIKVTKLNGDVVDLPDSTPAAFIALNRGDAAEGQQRLFIKTILKLAGVDDIAADDATERQVGKMDGARWLMREIGKLTAAGVPHTFGEKPSDD